MAKEKSTEQKKKQREKAEKKRKEGRDESISKESNRRSGGKDRPISDGSNSNSAVEKSAKSRGFNRSKRRRGLKHGVRVERELAHALEEKGFFVVRSAGSGHMSSPDILAFKLGKQLAFEVKSYNGEELRFSKEQLERLEAWEKHTGIEIYVAWKMPREGFFFLPTSYLRKAGQTVVIKKDEAKTLAYTEEEVVS